MKELTKERKMQGNHNTIEEIDYSSPEEKLIYAIIKSAFDEKDLVYFKSKTFKDDLRVLGITNPKKILQKLLK